MLSFRLESLELMNLLEGGECLARSFDTDPHDESSGQQRLHLQYEVCADTSPAYKGFSTKLTIQHSGLFFYLDRPAVASLIQVLASRFAPLVVMSACRGALGLY
jgi:hypothetical protein